MMTDDQWLARVLIACILFTFALGLAFASAPRRKRNRYRPDSLGYIRPGRILDGSVALRRLLCKQGPK